MSILDASAASHRNDGEKEHAMELDGDSTVHYAA